ncbi:MAG: hypothetical protein NXI15_06815 [Gammaproteobacteria bacterium]|jgi:hypothetical protein|nr:hypothetical protein [Gammaproteobacteria bacterium]
MPDSTPKSTAGQSGSDSRKSNEGAVPLEAISIVQRGNLKSLEKTLRKQWRMGQNIVLCWSADERGLLVILVPHYFLGNYCAGTEDSEKNESFVRDLISGVRQKTREELFAISERLDVSPTFIKLSTALTDEPQVMDSVEELIKRYGISYVDSRAVLLFDIVDFSLYTPFEQASQLNSLSYSLNSACNKLLGKGITINFTRTTTGDGYYVWNRDLGSAANQDLFTFMLLVVADNAVAQAASKGNTVPVIRTGYHIGGHYELYQAEGVNPSMFSYIVGDVTIELARMLDLAQAHQVLVGDFHCEQAGWGGDAVKSITSVSTTSFVNACNRVLGAVVGIQLSNKSIESLSCHLSEVVEQDGQTRPRRFRIVDKHGLSHYAYNLEVAIDLAGETLSLGLDDAHLPTRVAQPQDPQKSSSRPSEPPASAAELADDLASMLKKHNGKTISED